MLPGSAQAQGYYGSHLHEGFWFSASATYAQAHRNCDQCSMAINTWGPALTLAGGGTVNKSLLIGGEFGGWYRDADGIKTLIGNGSISARWFPIYAKGFFLKGGVGFSIYQYRQSGVTLKGAGPGLVSAMGYDFMVGRRTAVTPMVGAWWGSPGDLKVSSGGGGVVGPASGINYTVVEFGLALAFY